MNLHFVTEPFSQVAADVVVLFVGEGSEVLSDLPPTLGDEVRAAISAGDFKGETGETAVFYTGGALATRKLMLAGLGKLAKLDPRRLRRAAGMAARAARTSGAKTLALVLPDPAGIKAEQSAQMVTEGAIHSLYRFPSYKSEDRRRPNVQTLVLVGASGLESSVLLGQALAESANLARGLNWTPGNHLTATRLAEHAVQISREAGIEVAVYDRKGCQELGLGLLLAVNQGSVEEPRFIVMRYRGNGGQGPWLGIVGKGVTFDTGGISIKPTLNMWDMKYDMSGAGAVLGAVAAVGRIKPACDILFVISATDNMPDGGAYKPGDVIAGLSGKTVEIRSTDAEGRLVLADALAYAVQQGCTRLVTASTLTGAVTIALGYQRFGMVANHDGWEAEVFDAAEEAGERGWRLPHDDDYYDLLKSPIADMFNGTTATNASVVAGGLFLLRHVGDTPCVHLDIAAQAWRSTDDKYEDSGATGVAVRTFVQTALRFAAGTH